jgi:dTDP-L-rhamnose 4-epimerase
MAENVLVTGGAGFIGSHLVDGLLARGHRVRVLDSLEAQVHGELQERGGRPPYLDAEAELIVGDVRDREALAKALAGIDVIFHQAAVVGVGQSMYEIARYMDANTTGTAVLLDVLANAQHHVRKLLVASSMSIYGEGKYHCVFHGDVYPGLRSNDRLAARLWEMPCPVCGHDLSPRRTPESKPLQPTSIYAISKRDQEEMCLVFGRTYNLPVVALRYFNVYGPRQALSNPYTGVAAIFSSRLLNGHAPVVYEDGMQTRDYVHVSDVVQANLLAMEKDQADYEVLNVGTGWRMSVVEVAQTLSSRLNDALQPLVVGQYRAGDIRHCYADVGKIRERLGYQPQVRFEQGVDELVDWVRQQEAPDLFDDARDELEARGLVVG